MYLLVAIIALVAGERIEDPRERKKVKAEAKIERNAKVIARRDRKSKKVADKSAILNRYKDSEYVIDNFEEMTLSKQVGLAKKWEQTTRAKAKKDAKDKLQTASIANFRAEAEKLSVTIPENVLKGPDDKQERNIWQFIKKFHTAEIKKYKTANKNFRKTIKDYKKSVKEIKTNNIDSVRAGKTIGRKMRNLKQKQSKELKGSTEYNTMQDQYEKLRADKATALAKVSEAKKDVPEPVRPVLKTFKWEPRPRKGTRNDHKGKDKTTKFIEKMEKKEAEREKKKKKKDD